MLALGAIFVSALIMRLLPAQYGFRLNEFDPYFDYYAAKFIVNSYDIGGISSLGEYFSWHDTKSWYPEGRNISATSPCSSLFPTRGLSIRSFQCFLSKD